MATLAEIVSRKTIKYFDCVAVNIDATHNYYMTQAPFDLEISHSAPNPAKDTFKAAGGLLSISDFTNNANFSIDKLNITVAGIVPLSPTEDSAMIQAQSLEYIDKPVTIYRAFMEDYTVAHEIVLFKGYINVLSVTQNSQGDQSLVSIDISSHWTDFDRVSTRHTNNTSQQEYYPTDVGMEYAKEIQKEITWREPD